MPKRTMPADIFMQWFPMTLELATPSSDIVEALVNTGLSIRGQLIWLIHKVEMTMPNFFSASGQCAAAISTRGGLGAMPESWEDGFIQGAEQTIIAGGTDGRGYVHTPLVYDFLPPMPLATPSLSLYARTDPGDASMQGKRVTARIGFTTSPLDAAAYTEIAETWGW